jgi:hypothetical protein
MRCPLCSSRPARRPCPALGREICAVCCGTKREIEIACPPGCGYLTASRTHPPAAVRKQQDQDVGAVSPALAGLSEPRQQLFLFTMTLVDRFRGEGLDAAADADAASAAAALAATFETASKGLIYEQRPDSVPAQRMADGIRGVLEQLGRGRPSSFAADAATVLRRLQDCIDAVRRASPDDPRAFLALAGRLSRRLGGPGPAGAEDGVPGGGPAAAGPGPSIILP